MDSTRYLRLGRAVHAKVYIPLLMISSGDDLQVCFDRIRELVRSVFGQRVKGVSQAALPDELQRGPAHPAENVDPLGTILHPRCNGDLELMELVGKALCQVALLVAKIVVLLLCG